MRPSTPSLTRALVVLVCLLDIASAHSWVEQLTVVALNGTFTGNPGFIRGNVKRGNPGFTDKMDLNQLPPVDRANQTQLLPTDPMCNPSQKKQAQSSDSPRLQASAGDTVALQYQENGHVTIPQNQPGKPANRGTVWIYGTTQALDNEMLLTIHKVWNTDGTGGDKRGRLLSTQNFDDGQCYQKGTQPISKDRQKEFPITHPIPLMGSDLWCQNDIVLPSDVPAGKPYTLYWVWDWPTAPGVDPNIPNGKEELYTSCMDIDILAGDSAPASARKAVMAYDKGQAFQNAAVASYAANIAAGGNILLTNPSTGSGIQPTQAISAAAAAASTPVTVTQAPSAQGPASQLMTVIPLTTLMTTVPVSPATVTNAVPVPPTAVSNAAPASGTPLMATTITITPTVTVAMQPSNSAAAASVSASTPILSPASPAASPPAPPAPGTPSASPAVDPSAALGPRSNCTSGHVQKRSNIIGVANLAERDAELVAIPSARLRRSAKFRGF
ncbi:hypothetical protein MMC30_007976 [Trapelia coarctata]|nr:hypothetical protein [Trapelia coarctata]